MSKNFTNCKINSQFFEATSTIDVPTKVAETLPNIDTIIVHIDDLVTYEEIRAVDVIVDYYKQHVNANFEIILHSELLR